MKLLLLLLAGSVVLLALLPRHCTASVNIKTDEAEDPTGARAADLQAQVDAAAAAGAPAAIQMHGIYNFSDRSFRVHGAAHLTLVGSGPETQLVFKGAEFTGKPQPGVNMTGCVSTSLKNVSIDYIPKPPGCMNPGTKDGPGITLSFYNCSAMLAEDVTIYASPYMGVTSLGGNGGHVLRRLRFVKNVPDQVYVVERDGIHESDVRVGLTLEDSEIGELGDDFFNSHNTMLAVLRCDGRTCIVVNPHLGGGTPWACAGPGSVVCPLGSGVYSSQTVLQNARRGDTLTFVPFGSPAPLISGAVLQSATQVRDPAILAEAVNLSSWAHAHNMVAGTGGYFAGSGHPVDVWSIELSSRSLSRFPPFIPFPLIPTLSCSLCACV